MADGGMPGSAAAGPLPPRIEPTWVSQPVPGQHGQGQAAPGQPGQVKQGLGQAQPGQAQQGLGQAQPGQGQPGQGQPGQGQQGTGRPAGAPQAPAYPPSTGYPIPYMSPAPATAPAYPSQAPTTGGPASGPGLASGIGVPSGGPGTQPGGPGAPAFGARRRLAWPGVLALILVPLLAGVVAFQAYQINELDSDLDSAQARMGEEQAGDDARLAALEGRAGALEKQASKAFNPEEVAGAVLPSVFRVTAGQFTGTAFAVGKPASGGATNLFTNFHVVESVWNGGGREVRLARRGESYPATIVKVDKANDVAQLTTQNKFTGLVTAPLPVKSGQQVVVVGAPLGLEDTVTTGVVSAFRKMEDGSGDVIQFSAPINPGNSGGPVVNGEKQVVGIATAKARDAEGIGLAVPIKTACDIFKIC